MNYPVGIEYLVGAVSTWVGVLLHSMEVNNLRDVEDLTSYFEKVPVYDRWLAKAVGNKVAFVSFFGAFFLSIGLLAVPVVGPYLAMAAGLAFGWDTLKVKKIKKSLVSPVDKDAD
jgi:hypothetical protein